MDVPERSDGRSSPMDQSGSPIVMGDLHQHYYSQQQGPTPLETNQEVVETAKHELRKVAEQNVSVVPTLESDRPVDPVELQLTENIQLLPNQQSQQAEVQRKIQLLEQTNPLAGNVSIDNMFAKAEQRAILEASKKIHDDKGRRDYIARHGKVVGVTGVVGVGKTTLTKMVLRLILGGVLIPTISFIFLLTVKEIDFEEKCSLFDLLFYNIPEMELVSDDDKNVILKQILADRNTVIFIDGLDEVDSQFLSKYYKVPKIKSQTPPMSYIMNIIGGQLLPHAYKLVTSRPRQMLEIAPDHRPHFIVEILGLDENARDQLGRQICGHQFHRVKRSLNKNPELLEHCIVPINCIALFIYLLPNTEVQTTTLSDIIVSILLKYIHSPHMQNQQVQMQKLAKLAWNGFMKKKYIFCEEDLDDAELTPHDIKTFLTTSLDSSQKLRLPVLRKDKQSYFSHQIWQDVFVALYILCCMPVHEFVEALPKLDGLDNTNAKKFVYGICNPTVLTKAFHLFQVLPDHARLYSDVKGKVLGKSVIDHVAGLTIPNRIPILHQNHQLLGAFNCLKEFNNPSTTEQVAAKLLPRNHFSGCILPNDISSVFYVFRNIPNKFSFINVDAYFVGEAFAMFCSSITALNIQVKRLVYRQAVLKVNECEPFRLCIGGIQEIVFLCFSTPLLVNLSHTLCRTTHVLQYLSFENLPIVDEALKILCVCIHKIKSLNLKNCRINMTAAKDLCRALSPSNQLTSLDLSWNNVGIEGLKLIQVCRNLRKIILSNCSITVQGTTDISRFIQDLQSQVSLSISTNPIGNEGLKNICDCLSKLRSLFLENCGITQKIELFLSHNFIGDVGIDNLANLVGKLDKLSVQKCAIVDTTRLSLRVQALHHPMSFINLSENAIGDKGAENLSICLNNIEQLFLISCGISDAGAQKLAKGVQKLKKPMKVLGLAANNIHDTGAKSFMTCFKNVERLDLFGNPISNNCVSEMKAKLINQNLPTQRLVVPSALVQTSTGELTLDVGLMIPGQVLLAPQMGLP